MREILFRGKRLKIGDWVEGSLIAYPDGDCFIARPSDDPNVLDKFCIDPATIGQYTGLKDKNGKRIFEGDLLRYTEIAFNRSDVPCVHPVEFAEGGWAVDCWFLNNWLYDGAEGNVQLEEVEVIGNIHDNPELLEGGLPNDQ